MNSPIEGESSLMCGIKAAGREERRDGCAGGSIGRGANFSQTKRAQYFIKTTMTLKNIIANGFFNTKCI
jgi:hypothetical protein